MKITVDLDDEFITWEHEDMSFGGVIKEIINTKLREELVRQVQDKIHAEISELITEFIEDYKETTKEYMKETLKKYSDIACKNYVEKGTLT